MNELQKLGANASSFIRHADDVYAVYLTYGHVFIHMTIAQARELSVALARAADDAELKLDSPTA